ncbi:hypothetical protein [Brachyspira sp. G79]
MKEINRLNDFKIHFIEIKRFAEILKNASIDDIAGINFYLGLIFYN